MADIREQSITQEVIAVRNGHHTVARPIIASVVTVNGVRQWAYHPKVYFKQKIHDETYYTVTHIPTGGSVLDYTDADTAQQAAIVLAESIEPFTRPEDTPNQLIASVIRSVVGEQDYTDLLLHEISYYEKPESIEYSFSFGTIYGNDATDWRRIQKAIRRKWGASATMAYRRFKKSIEAQLREGKTA